MPEDNQQPEHQQASEVYNSTSTPYGQEAEPVAPAPVTPPPAPVPAVLKPPPPPPPPPNPDDEDEGDEEERGMLRMSFMEHLEELRTRLFRCVVGIALAFVISITFCKPLWRVISEPAVAALTHLGIKPPELVYLTPMEAFNVIYIKLPLLMSVFVGSPWVLYQVWAFISPGLYKREKRWAVPFVLFTAGLFIAGGCFAYFVAFRYGLEFLLGIGRDANFHPMVSINEYFDLFVDVTLGVGLVFELPIIIFFLTLLRLASPSFLLRHSRYAILAIAIIAAAVTPTPDAFTMMIFAVPMVMLYFVGVFASYLLVLRREGQSFPWKAVGLFVLATIALAAAVIALMIYQFHYHPIPRWPFLVK